MVEEMKKGDYEPFLAWIYEKRRKLYKIAWTYLRNQADMEDAIQETLLKAMEKVNSLREPEAFEGWFIRILVNECRQIIRKKLKSDTLMEKLRDTHPEPYTEDTYFPEEASLGITEGLRRMELKYKEVLILRFMADYSLEEISFELELPLGTVKSRLYRGLQKLRILLEREKTIDEFMERGGDLP